MPRQRAAASPAGRARIAQATPGGRTTYRTLEEINAELKTLAQQNPTLVRLFTLPLRSFEGRDIFGIEIAANVTTPPDGRPAYVQVGTHHAREWPANEATMEFGLELINGFRSGDPDLSRIVREARTYVIPVLNVDGFDVTIKSEQLSVRGDLSDPNDASDLAPRRLRPAGLRVRRVQAQDVPAAVARSGGHPVPRALVARRDSRPG